ncbi:MAG: hypothetical protein QUV07_13225 [Cyanobium sp. CZS 25K]|nr:hypothetical protein [Cyanobium sp. CZS25K]
MHGAIRQRFSIPEEAATIADRIVQKCHAASDADHSHAEGRLFSSCDTEEHGTIWVITEDLPSEAGGPITSVLFPEDH